MKKIIAISILFVLCLLILANQFHKIFFVQIALLLMFLLFIDIIYQFIVKKSYTFLSLDCHFISADYSSSGIHRLDLSHHQTASNLSST